MEDKSNEEYMQQLSAFFEEGKFRKPQVTNELAIEIIRSRYGLEVNEMKSMASFGDQNFHVKVSGKHENPNIVNVCEEGYTLKIINNWKSSLKNHFNSMHTAMLHINKKGLRIPVPVRNIQGETFQIVSVPVKALEGETAEIKQDCGVYLLTYISGKPVTFIENSPRHLYQWGELLAELHNALEDLECPSLKDKAIVSDLQYFLSLLHFGIAQLKDERKILIDNVIQKYKEEINPIIKNIPFGFIHGDYNDYNILASEAKKDEETQYQVDGILDFEDIHYGPMVWDVGKMLAHVMLVNKSVGPLEGAAHALAGYLSLRSLSEKEKSILKLCTECRLCQTSLVAEWSKNDPDNKYVASLAMLEEKIALLKMLSSLTNDQFIEKLEEMKNIN